MKQIYKIEIRTDTPLINLDKVIEKTLTEMIKIQSNDGEGNGMVDINCELEEEEF
jgi:hypothetical protein